MTEAELRKENALLRANIRTQDARLEAQSKLILEQERELKRWRDWYGGVEEVDPTPRHWWEMPTKKEREAAGLGRHGRL